MKVQGTARAVRSAVLAGLSASLCAGLLAGAPDSAVQILEKNCAGCHGPAQMSGLDVRQRDALLKGGKRGPAIVPGKPEESLLLKAVSGKGEFKMPPGKQTLNPAEVATLRDWIAAGARWSDEAAQVEPSWWSFRKPHRPQVPAVKDSRWVKNPIDAFVLSALEAKGMTPAPPADKPTLVRRAYFDLNGLPPTPNEIEDFVNDSSPDAWPKLVDRLLASPRYGETWGRHWLDVVRYAESGGFETDIFFPNAWRYRDYVIKSFNEDKPYDRFVQEQIAGDELWPDTMELEGGYGIPKSKIAHLEARIGTGLYTLGPVMHESALDGELLRSERLADAVDVTSAAFLGLTIGCARCHDHKFDPIRQKDYYRLAAIFAASEPKEIPTVDQMSVFDYYQAYPKQIAVDQIKAAYDRIGNRAKERITALRLKRFSSEELEAERIPREKRNPSQQKLAVEVESAKSVSEPQIEKELTPEEKAERERLVTKIGEAYLKAPARYATATVLAHAEIVPEMHVAVRGDYKNKGEKIGAGLPAVLSDGRDLPDNAERRKALALWLTSPDHPLTARVMVNRIWQEHFGRGIVATPNDFGRQGDPPSNPELLDWLATEFMQHGWSLKQMQRAILLSNAYQMSTRFDEKHAAIDPANRLVWRMNRHRLQAEQLRDAVLAVAGDLNLKMSGPSVVPPLSKEEMAGMRDPNQWPVWSDPSEYNRRSIYMYVKRGFRMPMLDTFDMPDTSLSCERRGATTVAPQALTLMNGDFSLAEAKQFAGRLAKSKSDAAGQVRNAWMLAFGRVPTAREQEKAVEFLAKHASPDKPSAALEELCLALFNMNEFLYVD